MSRQVPATHLVRLPSGRRFIVTGDMAWAFTGGRYYEANVEYWLGRIVESIREPVVYDVGANIGYYSVLMADRARRIYAFEPSRRTRRWLRLNVVVSRAPNVRIFSPALSDAPGRVELHVYNSSGNDSLVARRLPEGHPLQPRGTEEVRSIELDRLLRERRLLAPTLMKIDVEGGEMRVLHGAMETIEKAEPIILLEYSEATSSDAGYPRHDLLRLLAPFGYRFLGLAADPEDLRLHEIADGEAKVVLDNVLAIPRGRVAGFDDAFRQSSMRPKVSRRT